MSSLFSLGTLSEEDRRALARYEDMLWQCRDGRPRFSSFLDMRQQLAEAAAQRAEWEQWLFWGGYEQAERRMLCLFDGEPVPTERFPLSGLLVSSREPFGHRDLLGALTHMGIRRECVGDILPTQNGAVVYVQSTVEQSIVQELRRVGRASVSVGLAGPQIEPASEQPTEITGTVPSLRVDAVLSLALRLSREKAQGLIRAGLVQRNHTPCGSVSAALAQGDVLSVRGYGRCVVAQVGGASRKGRLFVTVRVMG